MTRATVASTTEQEIEDAKPAQLRAFKPTRAQDRVIEQYLIATGKPFSRLVDEALSLYFTAYGHGPWPVKQFSRRKAS